MNKESDILKWFNGEISTEKIKTLYPDEDFSVLEKAGFYTKQIDVPVVDVEKALTDFKARKFNKQEPKVIPLRFKSFLRVAAIFVVALTSFYFLFFNSSTIAYNTAIAQTKLFNLPDHSEVILNAQSNLTYNKREWKTNRTLSLDGEAFFKVTKGKTFTVNTQAGQVQVLGTQFNVKERDNYFEVQCYEGSVRVTYNTEKVVLTPGKSFRVVNGAIINPNDFNAQEPSWLMQESSFADVPLWQVIDELQVQYNIKIDASKVDTSKLFSGSFTHQDKNLALQSVTIPLKLSYKITGNHVAFYNYGMPIGN